MQYAILLILIYSFFERSDNTKNLFKNLIEKIYLSMDGNLVYYDEVTQCHSRYYYDNVCKLKYKDKKCYLIFCDINGLKQINDTEGHHEGTKLIKQVSSDLLHIKGIYDVCRFGGDEFVMFADEEFNICKLDAIKHISYGIYLKQIGEDLVSACKKADSKMYVMKHQVKSKEVS